MMRCWITYDSSNKHPSTNMKPSDDEIMLKMTHRSRLFIGDVRIGSPNPHRNQFCTADQTITIANLGL